MMNTLKSEEVWTMPSQIKIRKDLGDLRIPSATDNGVMYDRKRIDGGIVMWQDDYTGDVLAILPRFEYAHLYSIDLDFEEITNG
jgi:hypothetical protein